MRTLILSIFFLSAGFCLQAQDRCASTVYQSDKKQAAETQAIRAAEAFQQNYRTQKIALDEEEVIRIPVVVHVVYNSPDQNISDAQIRSGIAALNRDFRRLAADTSNTPLQFRSVAADVQIEFHLATASPQGKPTTGIERKKTDRLVWMPDDKVKQSATGGLDAWDSRSYLNIWIANIAGASGYATPPGSKATTDGMVIQYNAFGTINTVAPFHLGRTVVHEAGHWLGLKHIWGDASCGDDGVGDTPQQGFFTKGCPSGQRSSCNNTTGDMYMNYMDYTNDECMNLFTLGQRQRMRAAFAAGGARASMLSSKGLSEPGLAEAPVVTTATTASLYPNPVQDRFTLLTASGKLGKTLSILNSHGQVVQVERISSSQQTISVQALKAGVYFVKSEDVLYKLIKL